MRRGENPTQVLERVVAAVAELNDGGALPPGVRVVSYYDRQHLVDATLHTVSHSVLLGVTLVVLVLLLFLGRPATALLVAATIPFSLLFALLLMYLTDIPIGLLSIGAIDFGIIVDGAVIVAENIARRLGEATVGRDASPALLLPPFLRGGRGGSCPRAAWPTPGKRVGPEPPHPPLRQGGRKKRRPLFLPPF